MAIAGPLLYIFATLLPAMLEAPIYVFLVVTGAFFGYYIFTRTAWELADFTLAAVVYLTLLNISDFKEVGSVRMGDVRILLEAVVVVALMYKRGVSILSLLELQPALITFALWVLVSVPLSTDPDRSALYGVWFLISIMFLLVFVRIAPDMRTAVASVARAMALAYGLALVPSIALMLVQPSVLTSQFHSPIGMRHVPAQGAGICIAALLFLRWHYNWRGWVKNGAIAGFCILSAVVAFGSLNRVSWLSVAIAVTGFILSRRQHVARDLTLLGVVSAGFILITSQGQSSVSIMNRLPKAAQMRWMQTTASSEALMEQQWERTDERIMIWRDKMRYLQDHPVAGAGIINSTRASGGEVRVAKMAGYSAHSTFIGVLVETGWVGAALFAAFLFSMTLRAIAQYRRGLQFHYLLFLMLAAFAISLFEYNLAPGQATYWPFFASLALLGARRYWPDGLAPPAPRAQVVATPQQLRRAF